MSHYNNGGLDLSRTPMFVQITFAHEICREHDEFLLKYRKYLHFLEIEWFLKMPRGYKTFFMLNSTGHEISTAHKKLKYRQIKSFLL